MKMLIKRLFLTMLLCSGSLLAATLSAVPDSRSSTIAEPSLQQACPTADKRIDTAQVSQSDCCKGHKGVCGCRAGKIVCCDNTTSPNCTCHSDWSTAN